LNKKATSALDRKYSSRLPLLTRKPFHIQPKDFNVFNRLTVIHPRHSINAFKSANQPLVDRKINEWLRESVRFQLLVSSRCHVFQPTMVSR